MKRAFSLVEVVIALGLFSFAIISILALLPVGLGINRDSKDESFAVNAMSAVINDRLASPSGSASLIYGIPALTSSTGFTNTLYLNQEYVATNQAAATYKVITSLTPNATNSLMPYLLRCQLSWPPSAVTPKGHVESVAAIPNVRPSL